MLKSFTFALALLGALSCVATSAEADQAVAAPRGVKPAARIQLQPRAIHDWARHVQSPSRALRRFSAPRPYALRPAAGSRAFLQAKKPGSAGDDAAKKAGGADDLAKTSQNPVGDLISVPFQNNTNFGIGPFDRTQNIMNIQPVVPIKLSSRWSLISRTIIPVINQPHFESNDGTVFGFGDINPTLFLTPAKPGKIIWGAGPVMFLPTATDPRLGTGKYSAGPSVVVLAMPGKFVTGILASNYWSFAGSEGRPDINAFFSQIFVNYNMPGGWFLSSAPIITANWKAAPSERWTVPVGGGIGRVTKMGKQPVSITVQAYYNAVKPTAAADWQLRIQFALLFPKK